MERWRCLSGGAPLRLLCSDTSIQTCPVTEKCNVWSFGVLLWEIFEFGKLPYAELTDDQVITRVFGTEALRLSVPRSTNSQLYSIMEQCWRDGAQSRPTMAHLLAQLTNILMSPQGEVGPAGVDFNRKWGLYKPNRALSDDRDSGLGSGLGSEPRKSMDSFLNMDSSCTGSEVSKSCPSVAKSPSLENFTGSLENLTELSWLGGRGAGEGRASVDSEDVRFITGAAQVIQDLDDVLAGERTSSEDSKDTSPVKTGAGGSVAGTVASGGAVKSSGYHPLAGHGPVDFKLGPVSTNTSTMLKSSNTLGSPSYVDNEADSLSLPFILRPSSQGRSSLSQDDSSLLFRTTNLNVPFLSFPCQVGPVCPSGLPNCN
uniref:Tyrosine-protein kinase receptor Tie-1 n=1 Tax=Cacopsylla melanoneura TaxID=428564 RepID=A0A8D8SM25_9HEMI